MLEKIYDKVMDLRYVVLMLIVVAILMSTVISEYKENNRSDIVNIIGLCLSILQLIHNVKVYESILRLQKSYMEDIKSGEIIKPKGSGNESNSRKKNRS